MVLPVSITEWTATQFIMLWHVYPFAVLLADCERVFYIRGQKGEDPEMIKIAIVDDDKAETTQTEQIVRDVISEAGEECELKRYQSAQRLLFDMEGHAYFDLFLLDMVISQEDGLSLARKIRHIYPNPSIIFVTNHPEYSMDAFEVGALRYIIKPKIREKLPAAIRAALELVHTDNTRFYLLKNGMSLDRIFFRDLYYFHKDKKYVYFYTRSGVFRERTTMQEVLDKLKGRQFMEVSRGYVVNLDHMMHVDGGSIVLRDGTKLPVSRKRYEAIRQRLMEMWGE